MICRFLELADIFSLILSVWSPLLEPVGPTALPPWMASDVDMAQNVVVDRLMALFVWLPHSTYLPPGSETVESLFWQYYADKLIALQRAGSSHVMSVYVRFKYICLLD